MAVALEDRPREQVKEEVIDQLIHNYSHGVISAEAFERRLDLAMAAQSNAQLVALVADLELGQPDEQYHQRKAQNLDVRYEPGVGAEFDSQLTVLSSNHRNGPWVVPRTLRIKTLLGNNKLDFTDAIFQHPTVTIKLTSILAEEVIWVPENVNVVVRASNILSSVTNQNRAIAHRQAPTIIIEGAMVLGAIKIGVRRSLKDRFLRFANEVKAVLAGESGR
ncbi:DUF1707 domain-containing protein [Bowmanella sp. JS7-9]|uniref:DUF1707 domain-containing protein n=1 Tax=Pseudobowmanella zhangzhouensis TaxID=1537679 RepID=A0ABW1XNR2_9ALTE|nr:DUF1707 domain-containing protein [Bowmanella sp. JS7-9]TBX23771.1 hypothetical protein TK45_06700 [Bowmanella sp. JS7-9]